MKKLFTSVTSFLFILLSLSLAARTNRAKNKKSVAYGANYGRVALGSLASHVLEIRDGTLWAWGNNANGDLGDLTTLNKQLFIHGLNYGMDPNTGTALDPDYALVVSNINEQLATVIASTNSTLVNESCTPGNNAIDPDETVTVSFCLKNNGTGNTSNLVATLQNTGGITNASSAQNYGAVVDGGPDVCRPFTFTANGTCGSTITATLSLQDGATNLGTITYTFRLGALNVTTGFTESFDGVTQPVLPVGWTTAHTGSEVDWVTSTTTPNSTPNDAFAPDVTTVGNTELITPTFNVPVAGAQLTFKNLFNMEASSTSTTGFDGMVLEISINGGAFTDITSGGNAFIEGGYNKTISTGFSSPIAGRQAWSGLSGGTTTTPTYITSTINLPVAANGQPVKLKWRAATDNNVVAAGSAGVRIDDILISNNAYVCCTTPPATAPTLNVINNVTINTNASSQTVNLTGITDGGEGGQTLTVTATSGNTALIPNPTVTYTSPNTTGSLSFTPVANQSGTATITVTVTDNGSTANGGVNTFSRTFTVTVLAPTAAPVVTTPANGSLINTTTPAYTGTAPANSTVSVFVDGALIATTTANASGNFTLTQPSGLSQGSHTVRATAQSPGSAVSANSNTNTFTVDAVRPTVVISSSAGASGGTTSASPIPFTVTFSESVTGFVAGDVSISNGTLSSFNGSGTTYTFNLTPSANGAVTVGVPANVAQDAAANGNTAATQFRITYSQPVTNSTNYFRSITTGNWNAPATWESATDAGFTTGVVHPATISPDYNANTITVRHNVDVTAAVTVDQVVINSADTVFVNPNTVLTLNDGTGTDLTISSGGSLTIKSTSAGTGSIGNSTTATAGGTVTIERYIPARRAWRLMTAPLSSANTINESWQNAGVYTTGIGTFITGPGGTNGLDNGNGYSLKTYNISTQQLENVTATNVSLSSASGSADNKGYFMFVRGDRSPANLTPPNTNITTLSSKGNLQTGPQAFSASGTSGSFTLVGNPYASPVDFSALTRNNLVKRFYAWDPSLNTVGGYVLVDDYRNTGSYSVTPSSSQTSILQSSQAVFVQTMDESTASITFNESNKSTTATSAGFRTGNGSSEVLRTTLYLKNPDNMTALADGVLGEFNNSYSKEVNLEDGAKIGNINENLSVQRDGHLLALERRPLVDVNDTLFLNLTNTTSRNYSFKFEPYNVSSVMAAWLEDNYLKTSTPLSVTSPTTVDFSVAANTASADANRFRIVFKTSGVLPLTNVEVKAYQQNGGIQIDWNIATESNMGWYEVEKSRDGQEFIKIGIIAATSNNNGAASYNWFDAVPLNGNNFYRIKAIAKSGEFKYSPVVDVKISSGKSAIVVYPNPVQSRTMTLQFNNEPKGKYEVKLFNALGQQMLTKVVEHLGESATQTIQLNSLVSKGVYQLQVSNGENMATQQVIVE